MKLQTVENLKAKEKCLIYKALLEMMQESWIIGEAFSTEQIQQHQLNLPEYLRTIFLGALAEFCTTSLTAK